MITNQVWKIGDCIELLRELPDKSISLVFADPPYNLGIDYGDKTNDNRLDYSHWIEIWLKEVLRIGKRIVITPGILNIRYYSGYDWIACWWKPAAMGASFCGVNNWEPILIWGKPNSKICDVFRATIIPESSLNGHPCPKPTNLIIQIIKNFSNEYDTVLDPFLGSGTTLRACRLTNRNGIGFEINPEYEGIIKKRLMSDLPSLETWCSGQDMA